MSMLGRRPSLRSPWLGDGNTLAASGLSGVSALMRLPEVPLSGDAFPGRVDGGKPLGGDLHGLRRQAAGDLPVRVVVGDELAIVALQLVVAHAPVGLEDKIGVV